MQTTAINNTTKRRSYMAEVLLCGLLSLGFATQSKAEDYVLTLKDHKFSPSNIVIPADQKVKLTIKNEDASPAEFESSDLNREKVVAGNGTISVFIGPLSSGTYSFMDEFHSDTAKGTITVK